MAKFKPYNYDQMVILSISLQNQLVPGTLEHTIHTLVEKHIDLSVFDGRYKNDNTGATAINPKILLKIILFAYSRGLISSRQIERACQENITFMALCCGYFPDHSTIAHFVSSSQKEIESIFCNILLACDELGLLGGTHFSLDGVKLSANVSKNGVVLSRNSRTNGISCRTSYSRCSPSIFNLTSSPNSILNV